MGRRNMTVKSFQDHYPRETRYGYGCGPPQRSKCRFECGRGEAVPVRMPDDWLESLKANSKP